MRAIAISVSAAILALASASTAFARPKQDFQGKPHFKPGKVLGVFVWHDEGGQHVRFTSKGKKAKHFTGEICAATITKADGVELEDNDSVAIGPEGHCVKFDLTVDGAVDGIDFRADGDEVTYDIKLHDKPVAASLVHIGKHSLHPKKHPFVLNRML